MTFFQAVRIQSFKKSNDNIYLVVAGNAVSAGEAMK